MHVAVLHVQPPLCMCSSPEGMSVRCRPGIGGRTQSGPPYIVQYRVGASIYTACVLQPNSAAYHLNHFLGLPGRQASLSMLARGLHLLDVFVMHGCVIHSTFGLLHELEHAGEVTSLRCSFFGACRPLVCALQSG